MPFCVAGIGAAEFGTYLVGNARTPGPERAAPAEAQPAGADEDYSLGIGSLKQ